MMSEKMPYEAPRVVRLHARSNAEGLCQTGSGDAASCFRDGNSALQGCGDNGNSAITECASVGNAATDCAASGSGPV